MTARAEALLDQAAALIAEARAELRAVHEAQAAEPEPEFVEVWVAATRLGLRADTVRLWARERGMGVKRAGRVALDLRAARERASRFDRV
jgi:hypothetical protein